MLRKYFSNVRFSFFLPKLTVVLLCVGQICTSFKPIQCWTTSSCHRVCFICFIKEKRTPVLSYCHVKAKRKQYIEVSSVRNEMQYLITIYRETARLLTRNWSSNQWWKSCVLPNVIQHLVNKLVSSLSNISRSL